MGRSMNKNLQVLAGLLAVVVLVLLVYSNHFHNDFHFDDSHTIVDNAYIRHIGNIPLFFKDCTTSSSMPSHQGYRPLVTTTLAIDYYLAGELKPFWFHVSSFTFFLSIVLLLFPVQRSLYSTFVYEPLAGYLSLLGCAWYGLHTANAETVNYIISRSDILSTLAVVGSFAVYLQWPGARKYYLYLLPAALGMFAKETTIMFAPALVAYDYMIAQRKNLKDLFTFKEISGFFKSILHGLPALAVCVALALFTIKMTAKHEPGGSSVLLYAATQPYIILHYVVQFFFPLGLTADTDIPLVTAWSDDRIYIGFAFLAGLIGLAVYTSAKENWRVFAFGIVWFLLMLLPTSSFIALAEVTNDHRVFLPYIGLIISMVTLIGNLYNRIWANQAALRNGLLLVVLMAMAAYGYGTHQRNKVWKTDELLWKDVTEKSPNNGRGWMNYGLTLMSRGDYAGAAYAYEQAITKTPYYHVLHINMGILNGAQGKPEEAESYFKKALAYGAKYVEPYYYYARFLFSQGRVDEAIDHCAKGLAIFEGHVYSRHLMMDIYRSKKDVALLRSFAERTLQMYPGDAKASEMLQWVANPTTATQAAVIPLQTAQDFLSRSLALYQAGDYRGCIDACRKALQIEPNYSEAYNNICSAYNAMQQYDSAVIACEASLRIKPEYQLAKNNLAWAKSQLKK